ncbi:hypothetical protein XENTR_v10010622 [Xenopus tropicalis]|uniref:Uncharacterized protein LOC100487171 n=1 Tax=Xenopus tropicalis TaxID=8364 RepID=A0A1B8Y4M1_XENTR|nr:uncharacterized protein LOC100487171 [Xenopus tropicalis]XP_031756260.1 uncharacterized protein LOC100487171 [Xenopus tropicalis]KAE8606168.1 hypothetical protein XENTR_v10010622 [Xenopus tropicalis]|eukprot:XP_012817534.1 PREDICTED: uncharacterized protein LOC100487171 [Xenopus tropicalis]
MALKKSDKQQSILQFASSSAALEGPVTPSMQKLKKKGTAQQKLERCELESPLCHRKEKSKKIRKNRKPLDFEIEPLLEPCQGRHNNTPLQEHSNQSSSKKKKKDKKKRHQDVEESFPPVKNCKLVDMNQNGDMLLTPFKVKKSKSRKENTPGKSLNSSVCSPVSRSHSPSANSASGRLKRIRKNLYKYMTIDQAQSALMELKGIVGATNASEMEDSSQSVSAYDSAVFCFKQGESGSPTKALPSRATRPKADGKSRESGSNEGSSTVEEIPSSSGHSQDLFITQKSFMPVEALGSSSGSSPPLGQGQDPGSLKSYSRTDRVLLFSQVSMFTAKADEPSTSSASKTTDKSTQTEDVFSYLSLMSLINRVRVLEKCSEQPLDLALSNRIRAGGAASLTCIKTEDEDIILVDVKRAGKLSMSQQRRMEDAKLVQTLLNSSYYFKGKGDHCSQLPIAPLLKMKMKMENKKRSRKSPGIRH